MMVQPHNKRCVQQRHLLVSSSFSSVGLKKQSSHPDTEKWGAKFHKNQRVSHSVFMDFAHCNWTSCFAWHCPMVFLFAWAGSKWKQSAKANHAMSRHSHNNCLIQHWCSWHIFTSKIKFQCRLPHSTHSTCLRVVLI